MSSIQAAGDASAPAVAEPEVEYFTWEMSDAGVERFLGYRNASPHLAVFEIYKAIREAKRAAENVLPAASLTT